MADEDVPPEGGERKTCTKCGQEKPVVEFRLDKRRGTPRSWCKRCEYTYTNAMRKARGPDYFHHKHLVERARAIEATKDFIIPTEKTCTVCKVIKPIAEFWANSTVAGGKANQCKKCQADRFKKWRDKDKAHSRNVFRRRNRQRAYGISEETLALMLDAQGRACAICRDPLIVDPKESQRHIHVDHNHNTGKVRGILCGRCNSMLGQSRENIQILLAGAAYLKKYKDDN